VTKLKNDRKKQLMKATTGETEKRGRWNTERERASRVWKLRKGNISEGRVDDDEEGNEEEGQEELRRSPPRHILYKGV